jgi:hypothetical protein
MKSVVQYLTRYAEPEALAISAVLPQRLYENIVTIPLTREGTAFFSLLESLAVAAGSGPTLAVFIVNGQAKDREMNRITLDFLSQWTKGSPALGNFSDSLDILVVDRSSENCFPEKQGVGLARKVVADLALRLIVEGMVRNPWIFCTDGDAVVGTDYFQIPVENGVSAYITPYHHLSDNNPKLTLYDISLRYYELGLRYAGSPFAFQTLGSTLVLNAKSYAAVRGFPKREAGEDFYILNKMAKVGKIVPRRNGKIFLRDRPSDRVPFGTGAAVGKMNADLFALYDPRSFEYLKSWLSAALAFLHHQSEERLEQEIGHQVFFNLLRRTGMTAILHSAVKNRTTLSAAEQEFHRTFDAFRTLKLIHFLRDEFLPKVSWEKALLSCDWIPKKVVSNEIEWRDYLIGLSAADENGAFLPPRPYGKERSQPHDTSAF